MAKHSKNNVDEAKYTAGDSPIGLTGAFAPVEVPEDDSEFYDDPLGLTQAFGTVSEEDEWDEGKSKWAGFDWDASNDDDDDLDDGEEPDDDDDQEEPESDADVDDAEDDDDDDDVPRGRHAAHAKKDDEDIEPVAAPKSKRRAWLDERMQRSRRTRRTLIVTILLLAAVLIAGIVLAVHVLSEGQTQAEQETQTQETAAEKTDIASDGGKDVVATAVKTADVPNLVALLGKDQVEAVDALKRGATITSTREVKEEGNPIRSSITIALTTEPADAKTGTPNVYLGLDRDGKVIQVGYSAAASTLGFGAVGFADAVQKEHIIEKTMAEIGLKDNIGPIALPEDKAEYSTYASDKVTLVRERCPFSGNVTIDGQDCTWSSVLSYDYTTANLTGNVDDTVRVVYAYVTANVPYVPDPEPEPAEGEGQAA